MKVLCYIFSVMVIVLSLIPCQEDAINNATKTVSSIHQTVPVRNIPDACSPFCTCSCCTTPTTAQIQMFSFDIPLTGETLYFEHLPGLLVQRDLSVWQPPQIS
ncbi:DUF6660 family protein [Mucilaginibacter sp.]